METLNLMCRLITETVKRLDIKDDLKHAILNLTLFLLLQRSGLNLPLTFVNVKMYKIKEDVMPSENPYVVSTIQPNFRLLANDTAMQLLGGKDYHGKPVVECELENHFSRYLAN